MSNLSTTTSTTQAQTTTSTTTADPRIDCSVPGFFTTKRPCEIDPIVYLFEQMVKGAVLLPYSDQTYDTVIDRILDKGIIQENCDFCCPDCGNIYVFAGKEAFMILAEQIGWAESAAVPA